MLYITGDTHGYHDIDKLLKFSKEINAQIAEGVINKDEEIFVIIAGDFGFLWRNPEGPKGTGHPIHVKDLRTIHTIFDDLPFTTLFVDGNHENFDVIEKLPTMEKWGGKVQQITDNVYHLMRGEIYAIDGRSILTIGGGLSVDKRYRVEGHSWWAQEELTENELSYAVLNLVKHKNMVDLVVTHTAPQEVVKELDIHLPPWQYKLWGMKVDDPTAVKLNRILNLVNTSNWYFGHFHIDREIVLPEDNPKHNTKFHALYEDIKAV